MDFLVCIDRQGRREILDGPFSLDFVRQLPEMMPGCVIVHPTGDYEHDLPTMEDEQWCSLHYVLEFVI